MSGSIAGALVRAVDTEAPREARARAATELIRDAGGYDWVGVYDVGDGETTLIGSAGTQPRRGNRLSAPILGAESGIVIGTLDARTSRDEPLVPSDAAFLEECAEALRALYD